MTRCFSARCRAAGTRGPGFCLPELLLAALGCAGTVLAASPTPELQKLVRAATFEIVVKKPEKDTATYEKPLPLELIPFAQRNDAYWPVGTAFAIGLNRFVTAAHVVSVGLGSQFGALAIRDAEGHVYPLDAVLQYSNHEDYAVFSVHGTPGVTPLIPAKEAQQDEPVFAVGNALGEGVVVRDGLLTSFTPEAQDGRWKWLRFSAAASPGNSGGPLLDAGGRVLGVVAAKSPSENLNYALPIELVTGGQTREGVFEARESVGFPGLLNGAIVVNFREAFPLPLPWAEFSRRTGAALLHYEQQQLMQLRASLADTLFPRGRSATLLARLYSSTDPSLVTQAEDGTWEVRSCEGSETALPGDGRIWRCLHGAKVSLFRLEYPGGGVDAHRYQDSRQFLELLLQGMPLPRMVGTQPVRVTSLGPAVREELMRDRYGRIWQHRVWPTGYADAYVSTLALPTPDGYVGVASLIPSSLLEVESERLKFVADYLYLTYHGTLAQWQAFLERKDLRAAAFDRTQLQVQSGGTLVLQTPRLHLDSSGLVKVTPDSVLELQMNYIEDANGPQWDVAGVVLYPVRDQKTFLAAYRQPRPAPDAAKEWRDRYDHMSRREAEFSGEPGHNEQLSEFWVRTVASGAGAAAPASRPLYELVYDTDRSLLPRDLEEIRGHLGTGVRITE